MDFVVEVDVDLRTVVGQARAVGRVAKLGEREVVRRCVPGAVLVKSVERAE